MAGLQRDGLKANEVFKIRAEVERMIADGEEPDIAYSLACRSVVGVSAETFKGWKPDIFKLINGEKTPANSLLSGALDPAQTVPAAGDKGAFKRIEQLGKELDRVKDDHARLTEANTLGRSEMEKLQEQLAALQKENSDLKREAVLGNTPPPAPKEEPAPKPVKPK